VKFNAGCERKKNCRKIAMPAKTRVLYIFASTVAKVYRIELKQSNFERNAKNILGFEHIPSQIRDIEKIAS
jgi:hypothetical protein